MRYRHCVLLLLLAACQASDRGANGVNGTPEVTRSTSPIVTPTPLGSLPNSVMCGLPTNYVSGSPSGFSGILAVAHYVSRIELFGGAPFQTAYRPLPDAVQDHLIGFSPDGRWLAYFTGNTRLDQPVELSLVGTGGDVQRHGIPSLLRGQPGSLVGTWASARWVSDDLMLVRLHADDTDYRNIIFATLDPFSAEWRHDFSTLLPDRYPGTGIAVSPDATRLVYMTRDSALVLRDLVAQRELWRFEPYFDRTVALGTDFPETAIPWTRDSEWFAFSDEYSARTLRVDRNGQRSTRVVDAVMEGLSWSPAGPYLAGQLLGDLVIYDTERAQRLAQCQIRTENRLKNAWSADGRYLAYRYDSWPGPLTTIEVWDTQTGDVTRVVAATPPPDALLVGWSADPQWLSTASVPGPTP